MKYDSGIVREAFKIRSNAVGQQGCIRPYMVADRMPIRRARKRSNVRKSETAGAHTRSLRIRSARILFFLFLYVCV